MRPSVGATDSRPAPGRECGSRYDWRSCATDRVYKGASSPFARCIGVPSLLIEKFSGSTTSRKSSTPATSDDTTGLDDCADSVDADGVGAVRREDDLVRIRLNGSTHVVDAERARALREALGDALHRTDRFAHTVGEHRPDGSYVVSRRRAESAGHRKVFTSFAAVRSCFEELPDEFTAEDVRCASGSRRHILVRHFAEHPSFECALASQQPLTAVKRPGGSPAD